MKRRKISKGNLSPLSRISLGVIFLIVLFFMFTDYLNRSHKGVNLQNILEAPDKYEGTYYQTSGRVVKTTHEFFYLLDTEANKEVPVLYPNPTINEGDDLVVYGPFTKDGYMIAAKLRMQNSEPFKYGISFIAGLYFIWLFFSEWKLTKQGFEEKVKLNA